MIGLLKFVVAELVSFAILAAGSAPCTSGPVYLTVLTETDIENVTAAMNCSGKAEFHITWQGIVQITQPFQVSDHKNLTVTGGVLDGAGVAAVVDGGNTTGMFEVSEGSTLILSGMMLKRGNSDRGGAVFVTGSSALSVVDCGFTDNLAWKGGEMYVF